MWPGLKTISNISIILYLTNTCREKQRKCVGKTISDMKNEFLHVMKWTNDPICSLDADVISHLKFKLFQITKKQNKLTKKVLQAWERQLQISNTKLWCHNRGKNSCRKIKKKKYIQSNNLCSSCCSQILKKYTVWILMTLYTGCLSNWINGPTTEHHCTTGQKTL